MNARMDNQIETGIIIPIIHLKYLRGCLRSIEKAGRLSNVKICIVNDGNLSIRETLEKRYKNIPWIDVVNLDINHCFAGANNEGWRYLLETYPDIKYLGTLNSDTLCRPGWLTALLKKLESDSEIGMVGPLMEVPEKRFLWFKRNAPYSTWKLGDSQQPLILDKRTIAKDTEVEVFSGYCLVARAKLLQQVGMFTEEYRNSCEDIDLCLKIRRAGYKIVVVKDSVVLHYGGASRYLDHANTDIDFSKKLLTKRWNI